MAYNHTTSQYTESYTTYSGADIICTFGDVVIGALQGISYSVSREKAPVYTMGSAEPRSFSRGKRGIAGTLVFAKFDRDALLYALKEHAATAATFQRIGGDLNMQPLSIDEWDNKMTEMAGLAGDNIASTDPEGVTQRVAKSAQPVYVDEIPPFDITISYANEYGNEAYMVIYGVEIMNVGGGHSIDTITSEEACTFVARRIESMTPIED